MPFTRSIVGGSFVSSSLLANALQVNGHRVIALFPEDGPASELFKNQGVEVVIVDFPGIQPSTGKKSVVQNIFKSFLLSVKAAAYLKYNKFDIVHCNDDSSILPWGAACKYSNLPCVWHVRRSRKSKADFLRSLLAQKKIFISHFVACRFEKSNGKVVYNPVVVHSDPFKEARTRIRNELSILPEDFVLIQVGRDDPCKRPEWSVKSLEELSHKFSNIKLIMLGDFSEDRVKELLSVVSFPNRGKVYFPGWVKNVEDYLSASDVLIHPAKNEPFGRIFIESFASGKPVIVTNSGAAPEIVTNGVHGYISDDDDFSSFVGRINLLIENNYFESSDLINYARSFSLQGHASAILSVYNELLK
ncbi:hypothetical protein BWR19_07235 [Halomonas sp. 1513]|nr:hypothetical protein BWR19_07235 [Halomonas sp. 1513]